MINSQKCIPQMGLHTTVIYSTQLLILNAIYAISYELARNKVHKVNSTTSNELTINVQNSFTKLLIKISDSYFKLELKKLCTRLNSISCRNNTRIKHEGRQSVPLRLCIHLHVVNNLAYTLTSGMLTV